MKPIIGVMSLWYEERNSIWMLPGYMESINQVVNKVALGLNTMAVSQDGIIEA